ncbi:MAG: rhomboid family intramembrane serine protease [Planctomycetes bacterium]|nr:rhomboid family intramembrane serine protease [Planctomycetota bacterium]
MGIYDRDYYRREGPSFLGSIAERGKVCKWLIVINAVVFVLQLITLNRDPLGTSEGEVTRMLWLDPDLVLHGQVWRLLTHAFLHDYNSWAHILVNMVVLWWFGSEVEEIYGSKEFLALYLVAAVVAGVVQMLSVLPMPGHHVGLGASGAISAVAVIFACHYPYRQVLLFFIIPMPMWLMVALFVGQDLLTFLLKIPTNIGVGAHLGGALFGFLYYKLHWRVLNLWPDFKSWRKRRVRPQLRLYREDEPPAPAPVAVTAPANTDLDEHLEAKLDAVLEKMSQVGKENLTDSERQILLTASEIYRKKRT